MALIKAITAILLCFMLFGCVSNPIQILSAPIGPNEKILGETSGSASGALLLWLLPIGQNSRFEEAYKEAMKVHSGTTRILNPTIKEQWFWGIILVGFNTEVSGTAVGSK